VTGSTPLEALLALPEARGVLSFARELDQDLADFAKSHTGFLSQLTSYILSGSGKRVRPGLVYLSSQFGQAPAQAVKQTALAVELIHIATLVHDDLVDEAAMRRRKPTVSVKFGQGAAVLLGDYVYARAFERLAALDNPALMRLFADTTTVMCDGEIGQLERRYDFDLTEAEYLAFLDKKTASLMAASCRAGALLAGLPEPHVQALETFGRLIGTAFQIVDDILDLEGEEAITGKTLRTDLLNGKMTLPLIHFSQTLAESSERAGLADALRNPNGHLADLIRRVRESGSMTYSRQKADELLRQANQSLSRLPDHPVRRLLADVSHRLAERKS
jgi:octaprenyl-diphosphate synthase